MNKYAIHIMQGKLVWHKAIFRLPSKNEYSIRESNTAPLTPNPPTPIDLPLTKNKKNDGLLAKLFCQETEHEVFSELNSKIIIIFERVNYFDVIVEGFNAGVALIASIMIESEIKIKGTFRHETIMGDNTIGVQKAKFCIPNFQDILGGNVKKVTQGNLKMGRNRIILENSKYIITIDKCIDYKDRFSALEEKGGYIITHIGEIIQKKGNLLFKDMQEVTYCLNTFLSYINGSRTSIFFIQGLCDDEVIWSDFSSYHVEMHDFLPSWNNKKDTVSITKMWPEFSSAWSDIDLRDVLKTAIHWYLECNKGSGFVEGSLIMAQTALELRYNWYVVEKKKFIIGKDSESITAANKMRLLISQLGVNYEIPTKFKALQNFSRSEKLADAPETIVQIRNAIVHSQAEKRKKLNDIEDTAKFQALQLCIWYIELTLFKLLNYDGIYSNRCSMNLNSSGKLEYVPWKNIL